MAVITLGTTKLQCSAVVVAKSQRIFKTRGQLSGSATAGARYTRRQKVGGKLLGGASLTVTRTLRTRTAGGISKGSAGVSTKARIIKYSRPAPISAKASVSTKSHKYKTANVRISAGANVEAYHYDRDIKAAIADYLPKYYSDFKQVETMLNTTANESTRLNAKMYELLNQFYVNSATYGLERWEKLASIEIIPQRSTESQRHFINAKLRGVGTVTPVLLKSVVDAFYAAEITELPAEHKVRIKLVGKRGVPKNLEDIDATLAEIMPAHIEQEFEFTFLPWDEVSTVGLTWEQVGTYTAEGIEKAYLIEPE